MTQRRHDKAIAALDKVVRLRYEYRLQLDSMERLQNSIPLAWCPTIKEFQVTTHVGIHSFYIPLENESLIKQMQRKCTMVQLMIKKSNHAERVFKKLRNQCTPMEQCLLELAAKIKLPNIFFA